MDVWPAWDLQTFYPSEADECWTIRTHSDELTEPDVEIFMNLTHYVWFVWQRVRQKQLVLGEKRFGTFLWRPIHDAHVKRPNASFYGERKLTTVTFYFLFLNLNTILKKSTREKFA